MLCVEICFGCGASNACECDMDALISTHNATAATKATPT